MPKIKTNKLFSKRFKIKKKSGKIIKRTCGQGHFNAREDGNTKRNKRSDSTMSNTIRKTIQRAMPHG
jgi:ribosomal protein L35